MKKCIICRTEKANDDFNDEHVIPDSIGGYYHIDSVCKVCNSKLGNTVDLTVTDHKFSEFQRFLLNIKGKKGRLPNPFRGNHSLKEYPDLKVQLRTDKEGNLTPYFSTDIKSLSGDEFTIILDKSDESKLDGIISKISKRNGIPRYNIKIIKQEVKKEKPEIKVDLKIDTNNFKIGLLKIAYEFTVDSLPSYYDDKKAVLISSILEKVNFSKLEKEDIFGGTGFEDFLPSILSQVMDVTEKNHYLILLTIEKYGLICFVKLFNMFSIAVKMSDKTDYFNNDMVIGINDFEKKNFVKLNASEFSELVDKFYTPIEYKFQYWLEGSEVGELLNLQQQGEDFYRINGGIPFFNKDGKVVYKNVDEKLSRRIVKSIDKNDSVKIEYKLDEDLYIKLLPNRKLYKVLAVRTERRRKPSQL